MKKIVLVLGFLLCISLSFPLIQEETDQGRISVIRDPFNWPESTPEAQGLDSRIFTSAVEAAGKLKYVDSLLVVRNGHLIAEAYFNGHERRTPHILASASKTFIGALVGIGLRENLFTLDQKMVDFFPEYITGNMDPRKNLITLRHLLTMTSGFSDRDQMMGSNRIKVRHRICAPFGRPGQPLAL